MTLKLAPGLGLPDEAVTQTFGILAKRGAGKSNAAAVMAEQMHAAGLQFVAIDPVGAWWGLRSSADGKGPGLPIPVLGGYHGDVPLEPGAGHLIADLVVGERLSCVIDVSAFSEGEKKRFLADLAERLFREKGKPGHEEPVHLFLEEADDYAPQGGTRGGDVGRCLGAFQRIVKQGRARGLGATMVTQRSAALNKDLLTQIDTLIVLRTTSPQDRKAIEGWVTFHDADKELLASLSALKPGEAWVWSPEFLQIMKRVQLPRRRTFDSGATPKAGAKRRAPKTVADVDLRGLHARMQDTIERAKEQDPKELQAKIRSMERRIKELEASPTKAPETVVEREVPIEIPRLSDAQFARVEGFMADVFKVMNQLDDTVRQSFEKVLEPVGVWISDEERISEALERLKTAESGVGKRAERALPAPRRGGAPTPAKRQEQAPISSGRPSRAADPPSAPAGDPVHSTSVTGPQQRILDALAWLQSVRVDQAKKTQLALLSKQSPRSSAYGNNLGALRTAGLIQYPGPGLVALTDAGAAKAVTPPATPTNEDLWYALREGVSAPQWRILEELIRIYPEAIDKETLAERTNQSPTSSAYGNNLGALRSLGFIDYPNPGWVVALPVLFIEEG